MIVTAHYNSYGTRYEHETDSIRAAVRFLAQGDSDGDLAAVRITTDGGDVIEGQALSDLLWDEPVYPR